MWAALTTLQGVGAVSQGSETTWFVGLMFLLR